MKALLVSIVLALTSISAFASGEMPCGAMADSSWTQSEGALVKKISIKLNHIDWRSSHFSVYKSRTTK